MMKINQFAVYRVNDTLEGRKIWRHSMEYVRKRKLQVIIENYHQIYLDTFSSQENIYTLWERLKKDTRICRNGDDMGVSDVIVTNRNGEISCYYIDKETLYYLSGFIRINSDGAVITVDTSNYEIKNLKGKWRVTDDIILLGNQFYLMENEKYGKQATSVILDAYGKIIIEQASRFDEKTKEKIRAYLNQKEPKKVAVENQQKRLLYWQKAYENGEYVRSKESGTEQNYDMIDGAVNNQKRSENAPKQKRDKNKKRVSVLMRLHEKQVQVAVKSGKPVPAYLQSENMERNRK